MTTPLDRRHFLRRSAAGGAAFALGNLGILAGLPRVSAQEAAPNPGVVQLKPEIEPMVRLLEETPRERVLEEVAARVKAGKWTYQGTLAALFLAGVRNVQPRPSVGFKFHAVLVVNSAHLASLASSDADRWLPIFWAIDQFKGSQARDTQEGDWTMAPVAESKVPAPDKARAAFIEAMERWDEEAADAAAAGLARGVPSHEVFELFARYGARDFRSIGHKAIFVSNAWRSLQCIGWRHAEPILRSLAYALLNHGGSNPAHSDHAEDRPWRENLVRAPKLPGGWTEGALDAAATRDFLATLRDASPGDACAAAADLLGKGIAPQSLYDALFAGSGELLMRRPGIVALHAMTSSNAIRYAFNTCANDETRRLLLLQNTAFVTLFRDAMGGRGNVGDARIDALDPAGEPNLEAIYDAIGKDRESAARQVLAHLDGGGDPAEFIAGARRLLFLKGNNSHDYKFTSAALEDYYQVSPEWRNRYLAASVFNLRGSSDRDNGLVDRIRAAFA